MQNKAADDATMAFYASVAPVYAATGVGGTSRHLPDFLGLLALNAHVLELGCGGGRDAEAMFAAGFQVDPTDGSPAVARQAAARLGRPVRVMRFDELKAMDVYDAVWANASLLHVPREQLTSVLSLVFRALRPGGFHFASYKSGDAEGRDSEGRYFNYPSRSHLVEAYGRAGNWEILAITDYVGGGYEQGEGPWVAITLRKPA